MNDVAAGKTRPNTVHGIDIATSAEGILPLPIKKRGCPAQQLRKYGAALLDRKLPDQIAHDETRWKLRDHLRNGSLFFLRRHEHKKRGQHAIARGKGAERNTRWGNHVRSGQKPAIGLESDNTSGAFALHRFHLSDNKGRTDLAPPDIPEPATELKCGGRTQGGCHGISLKLAGGNDTDLVSANHLAFFIDEQRSVSVAIRADQSESATRSHLRPERPKALDGLGVDGNKFLGASHPNHFRTHSLQYGRIDLARGRRMFVKHHLAAGKSVFSEVINEAAHVTLGHLNGLSLGRRLIRAQHLALKYPLKLQDRRFVGLENLAPGEIKFNAISVGGNVAAGDHDSRHAAFDAFERESRCWNHSGVQHFKPFGLNARSERGHDSRGTAPQIACDDALFDGCRTHRIRLNGEVPQKRAGEPIAKIVRQVGFQSADAAGAEVDSHRRYLTFRNTAWRRIGCRTNRPHLGKKMFQ